MNALRKRIAIILFASALTTSLVSQNAPGAGSGPEFDVTSVKPNKSGDRASSSTFPLGPGTVYYANGGHFSASNYPLWNYILFAYKLRGMQAQSLLSQVPEWVTADRFDVQAQTDGNPAKDTKDQMRLMMRARLAERFKLAIHSETRQVPVFALVPLKPGKTGPLLQPHPNDSSCSAVPPPREDQIAGQFPALCGGLLPMPHAPGVSKSGARNITMRFIANVLTETGGTDRPVVDQTGFTGTYDFALEYTPESTNTQPPGVELQAGPTFLEALKDQLGLKLEPQKGPVEFLVLDHVERPSGN